VVVGAVDVVVVVDSVVPGSVVDVAGASVVVVVVVVVDGRTVVGEPKRLNLPAADRVFRRSCPDHATPHDFGHLWQSICWSDWVAVGSLIAHERRHRGKRPVAVGRSAA